MINTQHQPFSRRLTSDTDAEDFNLVPEIVGHVDLIQAGVTGRDVHQQECAVAGAQHRAVGHFLQSHSGWRVADGLAAHGDILALLDHRGGQDDDCGVPWRSWTTNQSRGFT